MTNLDDNRRRIGVQHRGFGWGLPAAIVAVILVIGGLFYAMSNGTSTTASNNGAASTTTTIPKSGPVAPNAPVPGPTTTAPAPNR